MNRVIKKFIKNEIIVSSPLFCEGKTGPFKDEIEYHWYNKDGQVIFISCSDKGGGILGYSSYALETLMNVFSLTFQEAVTEMSIYVEEHKETLLYL